MITLNSLCLSWSLPFVNDCSDHDPNAYQGYASYRSPMSHPVHKDKSLKIHLTDQFFEVKSWDYPLSLLGNTGPCLLGWTNSMVRAKI